MTSLKILLILSSIAVTSVSAEFAVRAEEAANSAPISVEDVDLTTSDNVRLRATHYAPSVPGPGVVMIHMCRSDADRTTWTELGQGLARAGIHALAVDLRGYGESGGGEPPFSTMPNFIAFWRSTGMNDVEAAYDYLASRPGVEDDAIGVVGASCGVFMGIEFAARHDNVRTLVLLSGPFDDDAADQLSALDTVPVLAAASEGDTRAYEAMKRVFLATSNPASRNLQFKGTMHGTNMFQTAPDLPRRITDWLTRWLIR